MKRIFSLALTLIILSLSVVCVSAGDADYKGLNGFFKSSRSDFVGKGGLTKEVQQLISFNGPESWEQSNGAFNIKPGSQIDTSDYKEGSGSFTTTLSGGTFNEKDPEKILLETHSVFAGNPGFNISITDVNAQAIGMWFYVDNVDNLPCDHDAVYNKFQEDCATIFFRIGQNESNYQQWNHTFYGSGWRYVEFAFATRENTPVKFRSNIRYDNMQYIQFIVKTQGKTVTVKVDDVSLITYKTTAKTPEAPDNGRWLTTGDYNVLDGATVTEWMGVYYDTEHKTQGSSSLMIHGRNEHVDYRETIGGFKDFYINPGKDVFCADIYIEDIGFAGTDWTIAFYDTKEQEGSITINYSLLNNYVKGGGKLKNGWNTVQVPFLRMGKSNAGSNFELHRVKIYIAGSDEKEYYNIAFDNMYVTTMEDIGMSLEYQGSTSMTSGNDYLKDMNKDKIDADEAEPKGLDTIVIVAIAAGAAVLVLAAVIVIVLVAKKKKTAPKAAPAKTAPKSEETKAKPQNDDQKSE